MEFNASKIYTDRQGKDYKFSHKSGGVLVFECLDGGKLLTNPEGRYRWDKQDHPEDIISERDRDDE